MPHICVFGCKNPGAVHHSFPNPNKFPERFKTWTSIVGEKLDSLTAIEIYQKKKICDIHFLPQHKNRNNRLSALAFPLQHLPASAQSALTANSLVSDNNSKDNIQHIAIASSNDEATSGQSSGVGVSGDILEEALRCSEVNLKASDDGWSVRSDDDYSQIDFETNVVVDDVQYNVQVVESNNVKQAESVKSVQPIATRSPVPTFEEQPNVSTKVRASTVLQDHNYLVKMPKRPNFDHFSETIDSKVGLYEQRIRKLEKTIDQLRQKSLTFKEQLARVRKQGYTRAFNLMTKHMTNYAKLFFHMQIQAKKRPKGRRFTSEEKDFALSLYKESPKYYRLLSQYFILPSSKAMKMLLRPYVTDPGINPTETEPSRPSPSELHEGTYYVEPIGEEWIYVHSDRYQDT